MGTSKSSKTSSHASFDDLNLAAAAAAVDVV